MQEKTDNIPQEAVDETGGSVQDTLSALTTAKPTIPVRNIVIPSKGRIPKAIRVTDVKKKAVKSPGKISRKKVPLNATKSGKTKTEVSHGLVNSDSDVPTINVRTDTKNHKVTITPHSIENINGFCSVTDIDADNDDYTEEIDIDIENDDGSDDVNPVLQSRSTSPNSVYEKLVSEANLEQTDHKDELDGEIGDNVSDSSSNKSAESKRTKVNLSKDCTKENGRVKMDTDKRVNNCDTYLVAAACCEGDGQDSHYGESNLEDEEQSNQNTAEVWVEDTKVTQKESTKKIYGNL